MTESLFTRRTVETPLPAVDRRQRMTALGFGQVFSEHMVTIRYDEARGWYDATLEPYGPISFDPATSALHYGQTIFEGLKAYAQPDGSVATFRPEANAARFARSAARLAMPALPEELFVGALHELADIDRDWIPTSGEESLYFRPFMIATDPYLGVRPSSSYLFLLIASPVGAYFPRGVQPVKVWLSTEYVRAAPGGTGEAKCGGNYAASLVAQAQAAEQGCDQVVWLDAIERTYIEEMGGMNMFFVSRPDGPEGETTIFTPELTGTLLAGVTRDTILSLAGEHGWKSEERKLTVEEWREGCASGVLSEAFACGTAAVVTPVGEVAGASGGWTVGDGGSGPVTLAIREALLGIQHGRLADSRGWMHELLPAGSVAV